LRRITPHQYKDTGTSSHARRRSTRDWVLACCSFERSHRAAVVAPRTACCRPWSPCTPRTAGFWSPRATSHGRLSVGSGKIGRGMVFRVRVLTGPRFCSISIPSWPSVWLDDPDGGGDGLQGRVILGCFLEVGFGPSFRQPVNFWAVYVFLYLVLFFSVQINNY
jgi:hypothetical protein